MTLAFDFSAGCSDDIGAVLFFSYLENAIYTVSPFETIDVDSIVELNTTVAYRGRTICPDFRLEICGERDGDPEIIHFFHHAGLDYFSANPNSIPTARLEADRVPLGPRV